MRMGFPETCGRRVVVVFRRTPRSSTLLILRDMIICAGSCSTGNNDPFAAHGLITMEQHEHIDAGGQG